MFYSIFWTFETSYLIKSWYTYYVFLAFIAIQMGFKLCQKYENMFNNRVRKKKKGRNEKLKIAIIQFV